MPKHRRASPSMASDGADGRISACRPHRTRARHDGRVRRGQDSPGTPRAHCRTHGSAGQRGIWLTAAVPLGDLAGPVVASLFGPLIAAFSVALYLLLASERATLAGQLAAVANVAAGALVTAMLLVQIAVDDVEATLTPTVHDAFKHVEFGLDLSWDVFSWPARSSSALQCSPTRGSAAASACRGSSSRSRSTRSTSRRSQCPRAIPASLIWGPRSAYGTPRSRSRCCAFGVGTGRRDRSGGVS